MIEFVCGMIIGILAAAWIAKREMRQEQENAQPEWRQIHRLMRERDALVGIIARSVEPCDHCRNSQTEECFYECDSCDEICPCKHCTGENGFVWKGLKEDGSYI